MYRDQRSTAQRVARDIDRYVGSLRTQLESYTLRVRPNVARSQLIEAAQNTEARNFPDLIEMSVIDASGAEQVRVTRLQSAPDSALQVYADKPEVQQALQQGQISYSPIR
ncbi:MAG TPA: hypothetical protein VFT99_23415, partial [Roseiflexaceae bacterium]|nr:hypothetical protein [Roseiflexaceae bacterium]